MAGFKYRESSSDTWHDIGEIIKGKDAVYIGASAPLDPQYSIWIDTSETGEGLVTSINGQVGAVTVPVPWKTSVTLASANWSGNGPYTQSVTISGVLSNSKVDIQPNAAAIQQMITDGCAAIYIDNNNGILTAYAIGSAPTANLTVQVTIIEVS